MQTKSPEVGSPEAVSPEAVSPVEARSVPGPHHLAWVDHGVSAVIALLGAALDPANAPDATRLWDDFVANLDAADESVRLASMRGRAGLTEFELRCLLLAVAAQIEPSAANLIRELGQATFSRVLTVRLALDLFAPPGAARFQARQAFSPQSRLVARGLLAVGREHPDSADGLLSARFEITQPALRYLLGESDLADTVGKFARLESPNVDIANVIIEDDVARNVTELVTNHGRYREAIADWGFADLLPYGRGIVLLFSGPSGTGKTLLAQALASTAGRQLISLSGADLPEAQGVDSALRDLFTEASLRDAFVLIDECDALFGRRDRRLSAAFQALEEFTGVVFLITNHPDQLDDALERRILYRVPFEIPSMELRLRIWNMHLPAGVPILGKLDLAGLASRYDFSGGTIKNAVLFAVNRAIAGEVERPHLTSELLEEGCRSQLRYKLETLTERSTTNLRLKDVVLPEQADTKLREILAACRNQTFVLNHWGFGERLATGRGVIILFDGPPGTGKTLAAEVLATEVGRPLHRVNIPEIVSKWVGETEKNIREVFRLARLSHSLLLFDEADALFSGRMAEVRSSNDRYANMEVNLLLQEIERFPGVCMLTTNHFGSLDSALVRRIQFRVTFERPGPPERLRIWQTLCPKQLPLGPDVDFGALARGIDMSGGEIKNALMRAAYRAADEPDLSKRRLSQAVLVEACRDECAAAGKLVRVGGDPGRPARPPEAPQSPPAGPTGPSVPLRTPLHEGALGERRPSPASLA